MGSKLLLATSLLFAVLLLVLSKPVRKEPPQQEDPNPVEGNSPDSREDTGLAYDNYLRQVVEVLESDPSFRKKLETANISEIKSGSIAMHLEMVNHTVRSALDELKRQEVARLVELARLQLQGGDYKNLKKLDMPGHLDMKNPHSFEMADLKHLILKTTADLEELDQKRKEEFKQYEMEKEYEKKQHLNELSEQERKEEEARLEALKKKHAEHPKVNHPGSKDQFEEVWDKVDHLEDQDFNPKTFFYKHDLNGDLEWSIEEVDALVQLELDKVYDARNSPEEDDLLEREEEMNRMRAHIFQEMDKDKNYRIAYQEFIDYTGTQGDQPEFEKDEGWKTIDEEPVFSDDDYKKFLESHHAQAGDAQPSEDLKFQSEQIEGQKPHVQQQHQVNEHQIQKSENGAYFYPAPPPPEYILKKKQQQLHLNQEKSQQTDPKQIEPLKKLHDTADVKQELHQEQPQH